MKDLDLVALDDCLHDLARLDSQQSSIIQDSLMFLRQRHTRDSSPLEFGSHWRYPLLSQATLMLAPGMRESCA